MSAVAKESYQCSELELLLLGGLRKEFSQIKVFRHELKIFYLVDSNLQEVHGGVFAETIILKFQI